MTNRTSSALGVWLGVALASGSANAQAQGFALDRFDPAEHGSEWFASESLDIRGHQRFAAGLVLDYGRKPLVLYDADGDELAPVVEYQLFGHFGGAVTMWDRVRLGLNVPFAISQDGESGTADGEIFQSDNATTLGDLRFTADARLLGAYRDPLTLAAGIRVYAPSGSRESFTGDGSPRFGARVAAAGQVNLFVYGAGLGFQLRPQHDRFADSPRGSEVNVSFAAGVSVLDDRLVVGTEAYGATVVSNADGFFASSTSPFDLVFGAHYRATDTLIIGLGAGPGLTRALGTPEWRGLFSITYSEPYLPPKPDETPLPPPPSRTEAPAPVAPPPAASAAPASAQPAEALPAQRLEQPVPGAPAAEPASMPDHDTDGVADAQDACPEQAGVKTDDPKTNGCPDPDRDHDGVLNDVDSCPDAAGPANTDPKKNGCPS